MVQNIYLFLSCSTWRMAYHNNYPGSKFVIINIPDYAWVRSGSLLIYLCYKPLFVAMLDVMGTPIQEVVLGIPGIYYVPIVKEY